MGERRVYISLGANPLSVDITDRDGRLRTFNFTGGLKHPVVRMPMYSTSKQFEQALLENYSGYGKSYILKEAAEKSNQPEEEKEYTVLTFANVQQGREFLNREHNVSFFKLTNKTMLINEAEKLGIKLIFESELNRLKNK